MAGGALGGKQRVRCGGVPYDYDMGKFGSWGCHGGEIWIKVHQQWMYRKIECGMFYKAKLTASTEASGDAPNRPTFYVHLVRRRFYPSMAFQVSRIIMCWKALAFIACKALATRMRTVPRTRQDHPALGTKCNLAALGGGLGGFDFVVPCPFLVNLRLL